MIEDWNLEEFEAKYGKANEATHLHFWAKAIILRADECNSNTLEGRYNKIVVSSLSQVPCCAGLGAVHVRDRPRVAVEQIFRVHWLDMRGLKVFDKA